SSFKSIMMNFLHLNQEAFSVVWCQHNLSDWTHQHPDVQMKSDYVNDTWFRFSPYRKKCQLKRSLEVNWQGKLLQQEPMAVSILTPNFAFAGSQEVR
ncbi:MAG: hypothetical protein KKF79_00510, partial [Gammaproteobacteria bacterium]|nr:hypothetical protein [Gammaproteobacteria bacterium]